MSNSSFEVTDRRGGKKEESTPAIIPATVSEPAVDKSSWKNVGYMIALIGSNAGPLVAGRAVGLRSDELCFYADYFLPQIYPEHFDWTVKARERLDTFIGCDCSRASPCAVHKMYMAQWIKADTERIQLIGNSPVPQAIEIMMKAEKARAAAQILVPRR